MFYLYYRIRNPRQQGNSNERRVVCRIARSDNGFRFEDIWEAKKNELGAASIERAALAITPEGSYRLYLSYESNEAGGWVIDVLEAAKPTEFQVKKRKNILRPFAPIARHLKDPYVIYLGGLWYMFFSYQTAESDWQNTNNAMAVSRDGRRFVWRGGALPRGKGWDAGVTRVSSILPLVPWFWVFYDGAENMKQCCEEMTGLALTSDFRYFQRVSYMEPLLRSPYASGSLRYLDVVQVKKSFYFYYEYAREDGSHELRVSQVSTG